LAFSTVTYSQSKKDLQQKRQNLLSEISLAEKLIKKARTSRSTSVAQLATIKKQIENRELLVNQLSTEVSSIKDEISQNEREVEGLEANIKRLKEEYAQMIYFAYKHKHATNKLTFLFAADDFKIAYNRLRYMQEIDEHRKRKSASIDRSKQLIVTKVEDLKNQQIQKEQLLTTQTEQKAKLQGERAHKDRVIEGLKSNEKELLADIKQKRTNASKLNAAIEDAIRQEIMLAKKAAEEEEEKQRKLAAKEYAKAVEKAEGVDVAKVEEKTAEQKKPIRVATRYMATPEAAALTSSFSGSRGKLPWPVEKGIITSSFGEHAHPVLSKVKVKNNGVNIATEQDALVRAVFKGKVVSVVFNPGFQKAIIVKHGDYFTVYSNMKETFVKAGDEISTKEALGTVFTDLDAAKSEVHFEVWKGTTQLNPQSWIFQNSYL